MTQQDPKNVDPNGAQTDPPASAEDWEAKYKQAIADSRKWEARSKANAEKAQKYDEITAQNKTLEERIVAIESESKALKDAAARNSLVKAVSKATGVSEEIVSTLSATDEESLTAQAAAIAEAYKTPGGAPKIPEGGKLPSTEPTVNAKDAEKRKFVNDLFGAVTAD